MDTRDELGVTAEITLAAVSAAAVLALGSLFVDTSFRGPLLLQVVLAHLTLAAVRRTRLNLGVLGLLTAAAAALAISWSQYAGTLWLLLPSGATWSALTTDLDNALAMLRDESVPLPVEPGFVAALSAFVWMIATVADWAAFRAKLSFEPLLPSAVMVVLAATFDEKEGLANTGSIVLYLTAGLLFLLLHRTWRQEISATWAGVHRRLSRRSLLLTGCVLIAVAVALGSILAPRMPWADNEPIYNLSQEDDEEDTRVVISPLVDIRGRLVDNPEIEVFQVRTGGEPGSYWRTTALDEFDGQIWRSSYQTEDATGTLPQSMEEGTETRTLRQEITISALGQIWLPAAFEARAVDANGIPVTHDERSGTLMVDESYTDSDDLEYVVESTVPSWTPDQLRQTSLDDLPGNISDRHLQLPDGFDSRVAEEAERITEGADTAYDQAIALQNHFQDNFEYDLGVTLGHDENAIVNFLFGEQRGYCEQFAGAYAAMARTLGIPSRLAIGFTNGVEDPNEPGLYRVQAKHAHAWVELYFPDYGWVQFEPTPTRGPTGGEGWLGIPPQQADEEPASSPTETVVESEDGAGAPSEPAGQAGTETALPDPDVLPGDAPGAGFEDEDEGGLFSWWPGWSLLTSRFALLLVPVLAYCLLVPGALFARRMLRRRRARRPEQQVVLAWQETLDDARAVGVSTTPTMTLAEKASLLRNGLPEAGPAIDAMADVLERSLYAEQPPSPDEVAEVRRHADHTRTGIMARRPWYQRTVDHLDIRRLIPHQERQHARV